MKIIILVSILLVASIIPMIPYIGPLMGGFVIVGLGITVGLWLATLNILANGSVTAQAVTVMGSRRGKGLILVVA